MAAASARAEKVRRIFESFDANRDGGLDREEMAALVAAVNPRVRFSDEQISNILDEVFRTYADFILPGGRGLTLDGLLRTYDDGAGDVDRDFDSLGLNLAPSFSDASTGISSAASSAAPSGSRPPRSSAAAWAALPHHGVAFESTWSLIDDLEILIKRLRSKQAQRDSKSAKSGAAAGDNFDSFSEAGWSREIGQTDFHDRRMITWDENSHDYSAFVKELNALRGRAGGAQRPREEAFDGHMAIGRGLFEHRLFREALASFKRACELQPTDVRPHFRAGNSLYALGIYAEAKEEFLLALEAAEASGNQWAYLLPQIHVNLGVALEAEGMVLSACEHYREAAILSTSHFRALKLLGSALFGVGEYRAAEKALEEAIFLRQDYADAHCDLGSVLHAMGEDDKAVQEFQKAIDLKPGHVDALYNLGGLFMDAGRFQRSSEMYTRVLAVRPDHWRAQLNKSVAFLGAEEIVDARKALKEALQMTKRLEVYDAIAHLRTLQKKKKVGKGISGEGEAAFLVVEAAKFKRVGKKTTLRQDLAVALEIRAFQRLTRLNRCDVDVLKKEMNENNIPTSYSGTGIPEKAIRKPALEVILRRMLKFLHAETFLGAVKAINERILSVLDSLGSGRVDLGMFFALLSPICSGSSDRRRRAAFDALLWRPSSEGGTHIKRSDASTYIKFLRAVYVPPHNTSDEVHGESDNSLVSYAEFLEMFDDPEWGFRILATLVRLEAGDQVRHGRYTCSVCCYPIIGSRFKEMKLGFSLCSHCYSEGKVPSAYVVEEYKFKEYGNESEALRDKCNCFKLNSTSTEEEQNLNHVGVYLVT